MTQTVKRILTCTNDIVPSYEVLDGGKAIRFEPCGVISYSGCDVRHYYCPRCHRFMNDGIWAYGKPKS